jgi:hypothetical protein
VSSAKKKLEKNYTNLPSIRNQTGTVSLEKTLRKSLNSKNAELTIKNKESPRE